MKRPTLDEIYTRLSADMSSKLKNNKKILKREPLGIFLLVIALAFHLFYGFAEATGLQFFPEKATGDQLKKIGNGDGVDIKAATPCSRDVKFTGVNGTPVTTDMELQNSAGIKYTPDDSGVISGGEFVVRVTAETAGKETNLEDEEILSLVSPAIGIDSNVEVQETNFTEGTDEEAEDLYLERIQERRANPTRAGNLTDYVEWAKEVAGVTRAWSYRHQMGIGTIGLTFVRDNDESGIIPSEEEVEEVFAYLEAKRPGTATLFVFAPEAQEVPYEISGLNPDTPEIRAAVEAELADLHAREAIPNGTLLLTHIRAAISSALEENDHVLVSPTVDQVPATGKILTYGGVTWT